MTDFQIKTKKTYVIRDVLRTMCKLDILPKSYSTHSHTNLDLSVVTFYVTYTTEQYCLEINHE